MSKKIIWAGGILVIIIIIIVLGLSLFVKSYLTTDRLRSIIVPKVEALTARKAEFGEIHVSLFKGISVRGFSLKEKDGTEDFMRMKEFDLNYRLFPLLQKKLLITNVEIVSPEIRVVKSKKGLYNFSDILEKAAEVSRKGRTETQGEERGLPYSIETDHIAVRNAKMTFFDEQAVISGAIESDIDLKLAAEKAGMPLEITGKADVKKVSINSGKGEITGRGNLKIERNEVEFILSAFIGKDTVKISGNVKDYKTKPAVLMDITANELDLDKLVSLSANPGGPARSSKEKNTVQDSKSGGSKSAGITASGVIKVSAAKYRDYQLKDFSATYSYNTTAMSINPISFRISGGGEIRMAGTVKGNLQLSTGPDVGRSIQKRLSGKITADLSRCELRKSRISQAVASFTQIPELADPRFDSANFLFNIGKGKIDLSGSMISHLVTFSPAGFITFEKVLDLAGDLKISPSLADRLSPSKFTTYIKDAKGWTVIPLKITGTTENPRVGLDQAALGSQVQKKAGEEIEKRIFKYIGK